MRWGDRPTADIIVIMLAMVVAFVVLITAIVTMVGVALGKVEDMRELVTAVGDLTGALIALVIGYVGGRGVNGYAKPPPRQPPTEEEQ